MNPNSDPAQPTARRTSTGNPSIDGIYPSPTDSKLPDRLPLDEFSPLSAPPGDKADNKEKKPSGGWRSAVSTLSLFLLAPLIALSITAFAFQSYQVDGQSMETTLQNNDRLIVNKMPRTLSRLTRHAYVPARANIIIFNQAGLFDAGGNQEKQLIKRVIGLPGDHIVVKDGSITVYNKPNPSGFNPDKTGKYVITAPTTSGDVDLTLGPGEIFVCGDNRSNSEDSRAFGPVNVNRIVGKLSLRILPIGKAKHYGLVLKN